MTKKSEDAKPLEFNSIALERLDQKTCTAVKRKGWQRWKRWKGRERWARRTKGKNIAILLNTIKNWLVHEFTKTKGTVKRVT